MDPFKIEEFNKAIKEAKAVEGQFIEVCVMQARNLKHYFDALVEQGFTPDQALEIVKVHGANPGGIK